MNILIITPTYYPRIGGIEECVKNLSYCITEKYDVKITIVTPFIDKNSKEYEKFGNIEIYRFFKWYSQIENKPSKFLLCNIATFFYLLYLFIFKNKRYDIVNIHTVALMGLPSLILSKLFNIPVVFTIHHYGSGRDISHPKENGYFLNIYIKYILKYSDYIVVTSKTQAKYLKFLFGDLESARIKYSIIPPGIKKVDINIPHGIEKKYIYIDEKFVVFSIGRLVKRKRYDILLKIAEKIKYKDIVFLIAGDGPEKEKILNTIKEKDLKNVRLLGKIPEEEKHYLLLKSNLYFQCSEYEGFGITYIEALSMGLPILAYKNDAILEIKEKVKDGVFIFNTIEEGVHLIEEIKNNKIKIYKEDLIKKIISLYSWDVIVQKYYETFYKVIKGKNE
ncbi:glycosyltransferase family 4 protein [Methanothermococcus sp. SCGC AD-155-C09]|nr:glycosyltransferase family 4 protein [Methanothermococcus sp. SCGC AD-155-C09]